MLEPTDDNPITDKDRRLAELLDLDPKTVWVARQPLPPLAHLKARLYADLDNED